jgi:signal transduction histidine kinase
LVSINSGKQILKALTKASHFQTNGKTYKLIAFHNINATLEDVESGAWKSLLNVMTHEIMNSIAPVASLADTLKKRLRNIREELGEQAHSDFEDIEFAMDTIHRRSEGLLQFSETYRNLNIKIVPDRQTVNLFDLLDAIYRLMNPSLERKGISLELKTDNRDITADLDRNLIEQVVINFITNATNALKETENPTIALFSGITKEGNPYLTVADNGCGIPNDIRDKIFIPFFSTKKGGSGIGLSLSREIVKLHKAVIRVQSQEGEGSAFTILMPSEHGLG